MNQSKKVSELMTWVEEWVRHYQEFWYDTKEEKVKEVEKKGLDDITLEELTESLKESKNWTATELDHL